MLLKPKVVTETSERKAWQGQGYAIEDLKCHVKEFRVDLIGNAKILKAFN